jgi:hypothetical protein
MRDKWGRRLFTAGGVALLALGAIHALSLFVKMVPANDTERELLGLMSSYKFNLMGSSRSMDNLMRGFSITFMLGAWGLGALDLVLMRERLGLLKRVALVNVIWLAVETAVSLTYFFAAPSLCLTVTLVIFGLAWVQLPAD